MKKYLAILFACILVSVLCINISCNDAGNGSSDSAGGAVEAETDVDFFPEVEFNGMKPSSPDGTLVINNGIIEMLYSVQLKNIPKNAKKVTLAFVAKPKNINSQDLADNMTEAKVVLSGGYVGTVQAERLNCNTSINQSTGLIVGQQIYPSRGNNQLLRGKFKYDLNKDLLDLISNDLVPTLFVDSQGSPTKGLNRSQSIITDNSSNNLPSFKSLVPFAQKYSINKKNKKSYNGAMIFADCILQSEKNTVTSNDSDKQLYTKFSFIAKFAKNVANEPDVTKGFLFTRHDTRIDVKNTINSFKISEFNKEITFDAWLENDKKSTHSFTLKYNEFDNSCFFLQINDEIQPNKEVKIYFRKTTNSLPKKFLGRFKVAPFVCINKKVPFNKNNTTAIHVTTVGTHKIINIPHRNVSINNSQVALRYLFLDLKNNQYNKMLAEFINPTVNIKSSGIEEEENVYSGLLIFKAKNRLQPKEIKEIISEQIINNNNNMRQEGTVFLEKHYILISQGFKTLADVRSNISKPIKFKFKGEYNSYHEFDKKSPNYYAVPYIVISNLSSNENARYTANDVFIMDEEELHEQLQSSSNNATDLDNTIFYNAGDDKRISQNLFMQLDLKSNKTVVSVIDLAADLLDGQSSSKFSIKAESVPEVFPSNGTLKVGSEQYEFEKFYFVSILSEPDEMLKYFNRINDRPDKGFNEFKNTNVNDADELEKQSGYNNKEKFNYPRIEAIKQRILTLKSSGGSDNQYELKELKYNEKKQDINNIKASLKDPRKLGFNPKQSEFGDLSAKGDDIKNQFGYTGEAVKVYSSKDGIIKHGLISMLIDKNKPQGGGQVKSMIILRENDQDTYGKEIELILPKEKQKSTYSMFGNKDKPVIIHSSNQSGSTRSMKVVDENLQTQVYGLKETLKEENDNVRCIFKFIGDNNKERELIIDKTSFVSIKMIEELPKYIINNGINLTEDEVSTSLKQFLATSNKDGDNIPKDIDNPQANYGSYFFYKVVNKDKDQELYNQIKNRKDIVKAQNGNFIVFLVKFVDIKHKDKIGNFDNKFIKKFDKHPIFGDLCLISVLNDNEDKVNIS